jgi:hypothetical protein
MTIWVIRNCTVLYFDGLLYRLSPNRKGVPYLPKNAVMHWGSSPRFWINSSHIAGCISHLYRLVNSHCGWSYARLWLLFIRNKLLQNPACLPCVDKTAFAIFCKFIPKCFKYIAPIWCSNQFYQTNLKHYPKSGTFKNPCSGRSLDRYLTKNHKVFQMRDDVWLCRPFYEAILRHSKTELPMAGGINIQ